MLRKALSLLALCFLLSACAHGNINPEKMISDGFELGNWMVVDNDNGIAPNCGIYLNAFRKISNGRLQLVNQRNGAELYITHWACAKFASLKTDVFTLKLLASWTGADLRKCKTYQ